MSREFRGQDALATIECGVTQCQNGFGCDKV